MLLYFSIGFLCLLSNCLADNEDKLLNTTNDRDSFFPISSPNIEIFDWQLLKELSPKYKNVLISPISLKIVLALLYEGSSGDTEREFQNVLQFDTQESVRKQYKAVLDALQASERKEYILNFGTRLFLDSARKPQQKYATIALNAYRTEIEPTNFEDTKNASNTINSWIEKLTYGHVDKIVSPDDLKQSLMVLANAIFFKGTWRHQFPKNLTQDGTFFTTPKNTVTAPFMYTTDEFYIYENSKLDSTFLRLPYKGHKYSLWIVLPNSKNGLDNLIKKINTIEIINALYYCDRRTVNVNIPKFKFSFEENYVDVLKKFGLNQMFQNTASFAGIVRGDKNVLRMLEVSSILQKTGIELDEEGSVIYAATGVNIGNKFGEGETTFNASHPFLFFLYEETSATILFIGTVQNPLLTTNKVDTTVQNKVEAADGQNYFGAVRPSQTPVNAYPVPQNSVPLSTPFLQPASIAARPPSININDGRFSYFDIALLKEFAKHNDNTLISPLSIKTSLAMLLEGAKGVCADEIRTALRVSGIEEARNYLRDLLQILKGNHYLESANSIFVSNKVKVNPEYQSKLIDYYKGTTQPVDFTNVQKAINVINSWVRAVTQGEIQEIVTPDNIQKDSLVVVANALHFKGKWRTSFDPSATRPKVFVTDNRKRIEVLMMSVSDTYNYAFLPDLFAHAVEIPYEEEYSMLIVMPEEGNTIRNLATDMNRLTDILDRLNATELNLEMPKFEIEYSANLINVLTPLQVKTIFNNDANLTGIVPNENVKVNSIYHKAKIEVDEEGTRAAAATGAIVIPLMGSTETKLSINKPFIYFIYHRATRSIIFEGILREPLGRPIPQTVSRSNFYNY